MTEQPLKYTFDVINVTDLSFEVKVNNTYLAKLIDNPDPIEPHAVSCAGTFVTDDESGTSVESIAFSAYGLGNSLLIFLAAFSDQPGVTASTKVTTFPGVGIEITAQELWNDPNSTATKDVTIDGTTYRIVSRYESVTTGGKAKFEIFPLLFDSESALKA